MVRCEVCGKEVLSGWICGVVPAHDSHKLGLCPEHDNPTNRKATTQLWERLLREKLEQHLERERVNEQNRPDSFLVTIRYLDGGVVTVPCRGYDVSQNGELLVLKEDGGAEFYPLQHIRRFSVQEALAGEPPDAASEP